MDENIPDSTENDEKSKNTVEIPRTGEEKRLANLVPPWKPGCPPPNPTGRPKGALSLVTLMKKLAQAEFKGKAKGGLRKMYGDDVADRISNAHVYMARVHEAAGNGEEWAIKLLLHYIDGMPVQAVNLGGQKDNPLIHQDIYNVVDQKQKELLEKHSTTSDDL